MKAIEFKKVSFSYEDEESGSEVFGLTSAFSLNSLDFSVEEGEFVAVLGHNGSGKSTLARLTNGLLSPKDGEIHVLGLDARDENNLFEIRKNVGIVFQNPDNQTVASIVEDDVAFGPENVGVEREEIGRRIQFALNAVGMESYRHSTTSNLSGGQKQRIAIAGVLALKPRIMILDESTAMLDPRGRKEVMDVVLRLNKEEKITVLLITHFPEEALLADRVIVMNHGNIVMQGKPQEVLCQETQLKNCSLVAPKSLRVCRALQERGLAVSDCFATEDLAKEIARFSKMQAAGTSLNIEIANNKMHKDEEGSIVCDNLSFVYNPSSAFAAPALNGVSLTIDSGEFFGIIGHTGSGKSTFVQHLNALIKLPTAEKKYKPKKRKKATLVPATTLRVGGFDLTEKSTDFKQLRKHVGMVFQYPEHQLFAETVFEDVAFGLKNFNENLSEQEIYNAVREAIQTVGLPFDEIKNRSPFELSGGQRRRVAIAGVIVTKPKILVLDEPAAGLDPLGKEEVMSLLHRIHGDWCKTVIVVSHDMDEIAENCTSAAVFSQGKILSSGSVSQLFTQTDVLTGAGLDVPFTAKLCKALREENVDVSCNFTVSNLVQNILLACDLQGAGTSLTKEDSQNA